MQIEQTQKHPTNPLLQTPKTQSKRGKTELKAKATVEGNAEPAAIAGIGAISSSML